MFSINQIKSNQVLVFGESEKLEYPGKTFHSIVENQQAQPTFDAECGNWTWATLVEGRCSHHNANPVITVWWWYYCYSTPPPHLLHCVYLMCFFHCVYFMCFLCQASQLNYYCDCLVGLLVVFVEYLITDTLFYCCFLFAVLWQYGTCDCHSGRPEYRIWWRCMLWCLPVCTFRIFSIISSFFYFSLTEFTYLSILWWVCKIKYWIIMFSINNSLNSIYGLNCQVVALNTYIIYNMNVSK